MKRLGNITKGGPVACAFVSLVIIAALLTACGSSSSPAPSAKKKWTIGFANYNNTLEFMSRVQASIDKTAKEKGVDLVIADNKADADTALSNADLMVTRKVDLFINYQGVARVQPAIMEKMNAAKIPMIAVFVGAPGALSHYGADDPTVGRQGGEFLGEYAKKNWGGKAIVALLGAPKAGDAMKARMDGYREGIKKVLPNLADSDFYDLDGDVSPEKSMNAIQAFLTAHPKDKVLIAGGNDPMAEGAAAGVEAAGRSADAAIVGQGGHYSSLSLIKKPNSAYKGTVNYNAEGYGPDLLSMSLDFLDKGTKPAPRTFPKTEVVTTDNVDKFLPADKK
ncbi:MAG: sugar ABC transporter substrate-binding protein [Chloroflexota bacterium]|nr:MAG: sugar ABC transporter substrate-binding protein [Chloroflexota bacterium]